MTLRAPHLIIVAFVLVILLAGLIAPMIPCSVYMLVTGDFPGSSLCTGIQEDSQLVTLVLTVHRAVTSN